MGVRYLETEEIMRIHEDIIQESGGYSGMLSYSNLDFAVAQAKLSKDLDRAAATLFYGILTSHPFVDGNKRTATVSTETFLRENGKRFLAKDGEIWDVVRATSQGKLKFEKVLTWIKEKIG